MLDRALALRARHAAAEVLLRDDVRRGLRPELRELDVVLLERRAVLAGDERVADLPLDLVERVAARDREEPADGEGGVLVDDAVDELVGVDLNCVFLLYDAISPLPPTSNSSFGGARCRGGRGPRWASLGTIGRGPDGAAESAPRRRLYGLGRRAWMRFATSPAPPAATSSERERRRGRAAAAAARRGSPGSACRRAPRCPCWRFAVGRRRAECRRSRRPSRRRRLPPPPAAGSSVFGPTDLCPTCVVLARSRSAGRAGCRRARSSRSERRRQVLDRLRVAVRAGRCWSIRPSYQSFSSAFQHGVAAAAAARRRATRAPTRRQCDGEDVTLTSGCHWERNGGQLPADDCRCCRTSGTAAAVRLL